MQHHTGQNLLQAELTAWWRGDSQAALQGVSLAFSDATSRANSDITLSFIYSHIIKLHNIMNVFS